MCLPLFHSKDLSQSLASVNAGPQRPPSLSDGH
jgi:hypothetical protein